MKWSKETWRKSEYVYNKCIQLDYIKELIDGTLAKERFLNYIEQDALYLNEYSKILLEISKKLTNKQDIEHFTQFSKDSINVEGELHKQFINSSSQKTIASPSNMLYTSFLWKQVASNKLH